MSKFRSKGKRIAGSLHSADTLLLPPQLSSLNLGDLDGGGQGMVALKRVKEEEILDGSKIHKEDREVLDSKILELQNYLRAYQYSMGLLMVEKKECRSNLDEMKARFEEAAEILKREQESHIVALSESRMREDNLRKALGVKEQCISELEKSLMELRSEIAAIKLISEKKMTGVHALEASMEEKNLEMGRKMHSAKLVEANKKSYEINPKLEDAEDRNRKAQIEIISIRKSLEDGQNMLLDGQRYINESKERINKADRTLKQREHELEEAKRSIEFTRSNLKSKEEVLNIRLRALASKEVEFELKMKNLHKKEKDLLEIEEKLNKGETEAIQKLLNEHNVTLDAMKKKFELELASKRKSIGNKLKSKFAEVNKMEMEVKHKQELISTREKEIESKMDNIKLREKDLGTKSNEHQSLSDAEEGEILEISKEAFEEGGRYIKKQFELKQEIEKYINLKEELSKEIESLREDREKFEKEWKSLSEKTLILQRKTKEELEKWHHKEEERSRNEETCAKAETEKQVEDIKLQDKAFENSMKHEKLMAEEETIRRLVDVTQELEIQKYDLEMKMQTKQEDVERKLQEEEREFETRKEADINISDSKIQKLKIEQDPLNREKEEVALQKKKHQEDNNSHAADVRISENFPTLAAVTVEQNETEESSLPPKNDSSPKQRGGRQSIRRGRRAKSVGRNQDVKAVVEDAKVILGENSNGDFAEESSQQIDDNNTRQKRCGDPPSENTEGRPCKLRQISTEPPVGEEGHNLRCSTIANNTVVTTQGVSVQANLQTVASHQASHDNTQIAKGDVL